MRYLMVFASFLLAITLVHAASAMDPGSLKGIYYGQSNNLGQGYASAWVSLDNDGTPLAYGMCFTPGALKGLPSVDAQYDVALPAAAAPIGFDHVSIDWNPHGHAPEQIYGVPHFDFHFYMMKPQDLQMITMASADMDRANAMPSADEAPAGYMLAPDSAVPWMGAHWVDTGAPELNGQPFTSTFIYGFYGGHMTFVEPMIAKSFLESKQPMTIAIKQPKKYARPGYYPTEMIVSYDQDTDMYVVVLDKLIKQ